MTALPDGTITVLYTDIVGSTRLWEQQAYAMPETMETHDHLLRTAIVQSHGFVFRTAGDAFCASFPSPIEAVRAAAEIQTNLANTAWSTSEPLLVRTVIHTTMAQWRGDTYISPGLNLVGRLLEVCHGGQILLTNATAELIFGHLPEGVGLKDLNVHRFRDIPQPQQLCQLLVPGLRSSFPTLQSLRTTPHNLPFQPTSFIGREKELADLTASLTAVNLGSAAPRLVTLVGPGGTGKTRLSLQVAEKALDHYPDGVWLIELAPVTDPDIIPQTLIDILGLQEQPDRSPQQMVLEYLRHRKVLLILDNCEHLIEESARLADRLLQHCPHVVLLASSREALGIDGERVVRVPSLPHPDAFSQQSLTETAAYAAVRLFTDRAKAVQNDFALTPDNVSAVAVICQRLDGIPLAIELAASRVRSLSPQQIATRLEDRFRLLTGGNRTALPRQRTLQALIDWSYDLLAPAESRLMRRLAVFAGSWSLSAAEVVCAGKGIEAFEVLDLLDQLVNKSLVVAEEEAGGMRYRMLETIRQYAQEKLVDSDEALWIRHQHLAYYLDLSVQVSTNIHALTAVQRWLDKLKREEENLRLARIWAFEHDLRAAMILVASLSIRGHQVIGAGEIWHYIDSLLAKV